MEREDSFPKEPNLDLTLDKNQCAVTFESPNSPWMVDNSLMVIPNGEKVIAGITCLQRKMETRRHEIKGKNFTRKDTRHPR